MVRFSVYGKNFGGVFTLKMGEISGDGDKKEDYLIPQMAVDCVLTVTGTWHPIKVEYEPSIVAEYMQGMDALYDRLMDWLAQQLEAEGWLARSYLVFGDWKQC